MKIRFGLPEILTAFGCMGLLQQNFVVGSIILLLGITGASIRLGMEATEKKENSKKIEDGLKSLKDVFFTPRTPWDSSNNNVH